jgi:colicin import membrane protein
MQKATAISLALHASVLLWAVVSFTGKPLEATPVEAMPVDVISEKQLSELTKGAKEAPKLETPKPPVEKIEPPKPVDEIKSKIDEKKQIQPTADKPPEPAPPQKAEAKLEPPKPAEPPKPDPIAEKLKTQDQPKPKAEQPLPPKKPEKQPPKFDASKIAALLDKRDPTRSAATGAELNSAPSLGASSGKASQLSQSELDALAARLRALWNPPIGQQDAEQVQVTILISFKRDGTLADGPRVMTSGSGVRFNAMRDSAVRAVLMGQPYTMLRPDHYDSWKQIEFTFDTRDMFHDIPVR